MLDLQPAAILVAATAYCLRMTIAKFKIHKTMILAHLPTTPKKPQPNIKIKAFLTLQETSSKDSYQDGFL